MTYQRYQPEEIQEKTTFPSVIQFQSRSSQLQYRPHPSNTRAMSAALCVPHQLGQVAHQSHSEMLRADRSDCYIYMMICPH